MPITLIRNNTRDSLTLWQIGEKLATIPQGGCAVELPTTITSVTVGNSTFLCRRSHFVSGERYIVNTVNNNRGEPLYILFDGGRGLQVSFAL